MRRRGRFYWVMRGFTITSVGLFTEPYYFQSFHNLLKMFDDSRKPFRGCIKTECCLFKTRVVYLSQFKSATAEYSYQNAWKSPIDWRVYRTGINPSATLTPDPLTYQLLRVVQNMFRMTKRSAPYGLSWAPDHIGFFWRPRPLGLALTWQEV